MLGILYLNNKTWRNIQRWVAYCIVQCSRLSTWTKNYQNRA